MFSKKFIVEYKDLSNQSFVGSITPKLGDKCKNSFCVGQQNRKKKTIEVTEVSFHL